MVKVMVSKDEMQSKKMALSKHILSVLTELKDVLNHMENGALKTSAIMGVNRAGHEAEELKDIIYKEAME